MSLVGSAATQDGKGRLIFKVSKIERPEPLNAKTTKELEQQLESLLAEDFVTQYVSGLRSNYGVTVNQTAVNEVTGRQSGAGGS